MPGFKGTDFYDTGLQLEIYGSYACEMSTTKSDLDFRINDPYTYRYINLDIVSKNLTFV